MIAYSLTNIKDFHLIEHECDIIELRLDLINDFQAVSNLKRSKPIISTLRRKSDGGSYTGIEKERLSLIESYFKLKPDYFDLEDDLDPAFIEKMAKSYPEVKIIGSRHHMDDTPNNLSFPENPHFFVSKLACFANSSIDALRLMSALKNQQNRCIAISMGDKGAFTRVINVILGSYLTFAGDLSAIGQLSIKEMREKYRVQKLNTSSSIYALIGYPLSGSFGTLVHNEIMNSISYNGVYVNIKILPEEVGSFFQLAEHLPFEGLSVTMPLKEHCFPFLSKFSEDAINTIKMESKEGFNTDGKGALNAIEDHFLVKGKTIVIIGAGGTAKAIYKEAIKRGAIVYILNRTEDKAKELAGQNGFGLNKIVDLNQKGYDLLIDATSAAFPIEKELLLPDSWFMDIKSVPPSESLQKYAKKVIFGKELFIHQAALQDEIWFNVYPLEQIKSLVWKRPP